MGKIGVNPADASYTLPKGEYEVMVTSSIEKDPKQGEHKYCELTFVVSAPAEFANRTFVDRLSYSPKAKARLASFVVACGIIHAGEQGMYDIETDDFKGKYLIVKGEPENFKGFESFRVSRFEMHPSTAAQVEAQINAQKGNAATASAASAPAATAPATVPAVSKPAVTTAAKRVGAI
jgi:hypothetical protein